MGSEAAGFEQASCDVVREVAEAEGGAAEIEGPGLRRYSPEIVV